MNPDQKLLFDAAYAAYLRGNLQQELMRCLRQDPELVRLRNDDRSALIRAAFQACHSGLCYNLLHSTKSFCSVAMQVHNSTGRTLPLHKTDPILSTCSFRSVTSVFIVTKHLQLNVEVFEFVSAFSVLARQHQKSRHFRRQY